MKNYIFISALFFISALYAQKNNRLPPVLDSINNIAHQHFIENEILESFKTYNKLKKLSDSTNDYYGQSLSNLYLGNIYKFMDQFDDAIASYKAAKAAAILAKDYYLVASTNHVLGIAAKRQGHKADAINYLEKALKSANSTNLINDNNYTYKEKQLLRFKILVMLAESYLTKQTAAKAKNVLDRLNDIDNTEIATYNRGYLYFLLGRYYLLENKIDKAINSFEKAKTTLDSISFKKVKFRDLLLSKVCKNLYNIFSTKGNDKKAFTYLKKFNHYNDLYFKEANKRRADVGRYKFFIENYKNAIQVANNEKLYQEQIAKKTKNINYVMSFAILLLAALLITIYINFISKKALVSILENRNIELELAKDEALKSSESKSKFISNVTHELRTPLYGVVGITSLLLEDNNLNPSDGNLLNSLKYSGDYLLRLINKILEFSKIESDNIELKKMPVDLRLMLKNIINSFDYKLKESNNKIKLNIDSRLPSYICCDNIRLSQVLINLIGNSEKFTNSGYIYLNVIVINLNKKDVDLRFEVKDTGSGIPKEKIKTIFDDFSQLNNARGKENGTGLGLTITKKLVALFNSKIEVESELGVGSTFSFTVNYDISKQADKASSAKNKPHKAKDDYNILVVEDNKINQVITKNLLLKANYSCHVEDDGKKAVEAIKKTQYDLILMDIHMPIMGGEEAAKIIRTFNKNIPILALTAADIEDFDRNEKYKVFNGLITKPFDNYEFFQTIEYNLIKKESI